MTVMRITDAVRARAAFTLFFVAAVANAVTYVLQLLLTRVAKVAFGNLGELAMQLLWLGVAAVFVAAMVQLANAVDDAPLPWIAVVFGVINALVDVGYAALMLTGNFGVLGPFGSALMGLAMLLSIAERALTLWILIRLAAPRFSWLLPLAATMVLLSVARSAFSTAVSLQLVDGMKLYESGIYSLVTTSVGVFNVAALLLVTWLTRVAINESPDGVIPAMPPTEHGLHAPPVADEPASAGSDFAIGAVILGIGVAVTTISVSTASNGGRYIVATGAIAVGLGRIIRGFIRLGRRQQ